MLDTPAMSVLQSALDYASVRQDALADNLANVNTPGYQRKDASFASVLAQASTTSDDEDLPLVGSRDDAAQIPIDADTDNSGDVDVITPGGGPMRLDGNNIDVDVEMGRLAKNQIYFQGLTELVGGQFASLKSVINSG